MSNANKIARYLTTIDSTPSYAINILVVKPMTVATTFFFFIHPYTSSQSVARISSESLKTQGKNFPLHTAIIVSETI